MERYKEQKKDLHMVFIDLEKPYDKVSRNVMWWALEKKKVSTKYVTLIKDMYDDIVTSVRACDRETSDFSFKIGLHQGSALSPYMCCPSDGCSHEGYTRGDSLVYALC